MFPRFRFRRSEMSREHSHMAHRSPAHPRPAEGHPSGAGADLPSARCPAGLRSPAVLALPLRRALPLTAVCGPGPVGGGGRRDRTQRPQPRAPGGPYLAPAAARSPRSTPVSPRPAPGLPAGEKQPSAWAAHGRLTRGQTDESARRRGDGSATARRDRSCWAPRGGGGCGLLTISRPSAANVQRPTERLQKCVERSRSPDLPAVCCTVRTRARRGRLALPHDGSAGRRSAHSTLRRASPGTAATAARPLRGTRRRGGRHVPCPHRPYESDALKLP